MCDETLINSAVTLGFAGAAVVTTRQIPFDFSFRPYCEENLCGQYGINHSCPPACGSCQEMKDQILRKKKALVLQTIWEISDYTDKEAIGNAKGFHNRASITLAETLRKQGIDCLMVGASGCALCSPCSAKSGLPCRFPQMQYSCMSAYCIFVRKLCELCDLEYDCGEGLLSFFGMLVYG